MTRTIGIGIQSFGEIIDKNYFYVDKTCFIKEWWESGDSVTLITRPRRFGKTLTMSMVEHFFSVKYQDRMDLFQGLQIGREPGYDKLQGTYPVIFLSFADVKEIRFTQARKAICRIIKECYRRFSFLLDTDVLNEEERKEFGQISVDMEDNEAAFSLKALSSYLYRYYGKKVIILLDEYDTPMQEAYVNGYWKELTAFARSLFNSTFKSNPWLERGLMTGITRISKESIFSDLNNLKVVGTTSGEYARSFGFTEPEVFSAMDEYGYSEKDLVKKWYDGFTFGNVRDIYNPWSILNYLDTGEFKAYWANTSSNGLVGSLIREGSPRVKTVMEDLLKGEVLKTQLDEQVVFCQLDNKISAIWSLLLAAGYLKVDNYHMDPEIGKPSYELSLTNMEVRLMFEGMIEDWFLEYTPAYNDIIKALMLGDVKAMNTYMNRVALATFSFFDTGRHPSQESEPERFYHGFVLGLMVELSDRYVLLSNRESGFGRYDVLLEPKKEGLDGIILEFKVRDAQEEKSLDDTAMAALLQIEEKGYEAALLQKNVPKDRIRKYGFAFEGKKVLILTAKTGDSWVIDCGKSELVEV